jgi:putative ATP-dependent DNA ligase
MGATTKLWYSSSAGEGGRDQINPNHTVFYHPKPSPSPLDAARCWLRVLRLHPRKLDSSMGVWPASGVEGLTWIKKPEEWMVEAVAEAVKADADRVTALTQHGTLRFREFRGIVYAIFRRSVLGLPEGTAVIVERSSHMLVPGYPPIQRMVLPSVALPRHFIDRIVVEEKMNGYNVRVVLYNGKLLAFTRGGFICPYTTSRINRLYGDSLRQLYSELDPSKHIVAGEVVGLENPYTRYFYPEAPRFDYFIFDILTGEKPLPPLQRIELVEKYGLKHVRLLAVMDKSAVEEFRKIIEHLDRNGREGVVVKDPEYRVPPLKYTTSSTNIGDIRFGMRFPLEEGRSFIFSRVLREIFRLYEEGAELSKLDNVALELGRAILEPALESLRKVASGDMLYEEFTLEFADEGELEEFTEYMSELGVDVIVVSREETGEGLRVKMRKIKESWIQLRKMLETGLSPID